MHISEGVLSAPVLVTGAALAAAGTAVGLKRLDYDRIAHVGLLSAAFFIASLIHLPVGVTSVHLIMNGLVGVLLGWVAFPAILVALLLQAVFFQFGGITTLGVNTVIMALPAVFSFYLCAPWLAKDRPWSTLAAFGCGFGAVLLSTLCMALALVFTEENFIEVAYVGVLANIPVMIVEGIVVAICIAFLKRVKPAILPGHSP
jgi:cobalt/nickel transport system permease protein